MASTRQVQAAKRNVKKAQAAAKSKRTIAHLPKSTRRGLQAEARKGARRGKGLQKRIFSGGPLGLDSSARIVASHQSLTKSVRSETAPVRLRIVDSSLGFLPSLS